MKKILLLLIITLSSFIWGQDLYKINIDYAAYGGGIRLCKNWSKLILIYSDGSLEEIMYDGTTHQYNKTLTLSRPKKISSVYFEAYARRRATADAFGGCSGDDESPRINLLVSPCTTKTHFDNGDNNTTSIRYRISATLYPIHTLSPEVISIQNGISLYNTYLPPNDKISLLSNKDLDADLYQYQYSF